MRIVLMLASASVLLGCATSSFQLPTTPPPPAWTGESGFIYGPRKIHEGVHGPGGLIAESELFLRRTGTLAETVQLKSISGEPLIVPAGTKVFATNYSAKSSPRQIDPIEWCAVFPNGFDNKQPGRQTLCIFWEAPDRARYVPQYEVGALPFRSEIRGSTMTGPVPQIAEGKVDLGIRIRSALRVSKIDAKNIVLDRFLSDGTRESLDERQAYFWPPQPPLLYAREYGVISLQPSADFSRVNARAAPKLDLKPARTAEHAHLPIARNFGRACGAIATDEELTAARVTSPKFTPKHPIMQPNYPADARNRGEQGTMDMVMLVNEDGWVSQVKISKSTGFAVLDQSGVASASEWRLEPGTVDGKARCMWQVFSLTFNATR